MVWEAAKTATVTTVVAFGSVAVMLIGVGLVVGLSMLLSRWLKTLKTMKTWQACIVGCVAAAVIVWVMLFAGTLCCGTVRP